MTSRGGAAQQPAHAREQLVGRERLQEVVVGPDEEPRDPVERLRPLARDEDDRQVVAELARAARRQTS